MSHKDTMIYLCLQIRCADSHALLLKAASKFGLKVEDCSDEMKGIPSCAWGLGMECKMMRVVVNKILRDSAVIKRGKRKNEAIKIERENDRKRKTKERKEDRKKKKGEGTDCRR